jgi:hypothetical protein
MNRIPSPEEVGPLPPPEPPPGIPAGLAADPPLMHEAPGLGEPSPLRDAPREEGLRPIREAPRLMVDLTRERLRSGNANIDPFNIDDIKLQYAPTNGDPRRGNIDSEIDFNWKRYECLGRADYSEQREYYLQGWRPILHSHFPGRFGPEGTEGPVIVKDMILMERPMRLTVKARNDEMEQATRAMRVNRENLGATPEGQAPRMVISDRSTREAIEIPE